MLEFDVIEADPDGELEDWQLDAVKDQCCAACCTDVTELWLETPRNLKGTAIAYIDAEENVWCVECFHEWANDDDIDDERNMLSCCIRQQTAWAGDAATCGDCHELLKYCGSTFYSYQGNAAFCSHCYEAWDDTWDDAWDGAWDGAWDYPDGAEWTPACAECDSTLSGSAYVVDKDESCYCFACWERWLPRQLGADASSRTLTAAEAANTQRNDDNLAKLRAWYPEYCAYHVYFHHVRGRDQGCKFGDVHKCARGSHAAPPGLAMKARGLDLDVELVRADLTQPLASRHLASRHSSLTAPEPHGNRASRHSSLAAPTRASPASNRAREMSAG